MASDEHGHPRTLPPILQVGDVLISSDILTEKFCCDLSVCKGQCCVEGDAGAPVTMEEIAEIEDCLDDVRQDLSASAQSVIDKQGVAYTDQEGDLVTSIVRGRDCVFTFEALLQGDGSFVATKDPSPCVTLCALEKAYRAGKTRFCKPVSCALYPIREKRFGNGLVGLNYNRWDVCKMAVAKGIQENVRLYQFLRDPLIRRFGQAWYDEICEVASTFSVL